MRMIMQMSFPLDPFNLMVRKGTIDETMKKLIGATKPDAAYFTELNGHRGAILIVDVANPHDVPRLAEPWFLTLNAEINFRVCMTPEDLGRAGLSTLGSTWA